jgi:16S rRNA (cytosine1402-N4)-methyltransferase
MDKCFKDVHVSVLSEEVLEYLRPERGKVYVDGTLGLGGHAQQILQASEPDGTVVGFEWDDQAAQLAQQRLEIFGKRLCLVPLSYAQLLEGLKTTEFDMVDGLLLDLGVSSLQLDKGERGFSFQVDAPLDMRMDRRQSETAAKLVRRLSKDDLADIFYNYGEERQARRIAAHLVEARGKCPIETTRQLAELVADSIPRRYHPKKKHVATKVFQALRIAVNRELDNLVRILGDAPSVLVPGGRICVITFHSLEDRIVKQAFANNSEYRVVTKKPVSPTESEVVGNPRARSAKLRVAEKV